MLTILILLTPLATAIGAVLVERTRRTTTLKIVSALPPGSEIVEQRGDRSWWQVRLPTECTVQIIEIEGGAHDGGVD